MEIVAGDMEIALRNSLDRFLVNRHDFHERRRRVGSEQWQPDLWRSLAELGILGTGIAEADGGLGGGPAEIGAVMECLGRHLVCEPFLSTAVMGAGFLNHAAGPARDVLRAIPGGDVVVAIAHHEERASADLDCVATTAVRSDDGWLLSGRKAIVLDAPQATHLIVTARTSADADDAAGFSVFLLDADSAGISLVEYRAIDGARAADVVLENVAAPASRLIGNEGDGLVLVQRVFDEAIAAICAEACGVMQSMLDQTVAYTKQRTQFGRAIADNQVLQHRMVDMLVEIKQSTALAMVARLKLGSADRAAAVSAAKNRIGRACRFVGQNAIQLHGAIGITDETAISHFFKRSLMIEKQFGSTEYHLARYERLQFAPA